MFFSDRNRSLESLHPEKSVDNVFDESAVDIALDTILSSDTPVWLTLAQLNNQTSATNSLAKGLNWARTLGDASRIGFKMIYAPIDQQEWFEPTLSYYTTLLHKRLMGRTVLDSNLLNGNQFNTHMYTHCTPNSNGAFVIYGVNMADSEANVQAKMPPIRSGSDYKEYVLTVNQYSGKVQLNGIDIVEGRPLIPINKPKRLALPAHLSLPARSVGFWVFSNAELPACERNLDEEPLRLPTLPKTSSEELLQLLIREDIQRDDDMEKNPISRMRVDGHRMRRSVPNAIEKEHKINSIQQNAHVNDNEIHKRDRRSIDDDMAAARSRRADNLLLNEFEAMKQQQINLPFAAKMDTATGLKRPKRQIGNALTRLMEKIELKKPSFNLKPPTFKLPQIALPPITAVHDIYPPNSAERRVFHSVENPNLPAGDVHFDFEEMANGAPNPANANYEPQPQNGPGPINREIQEVPMVNDPVRDGMPEDLNVPNTPDQYYESLFGDAPIALTPPPLVQPYHHMPPAEMGPPPPARYEELWEMDAAQMPPMPSLAPKQSNQPQEAPVNTNIDFVVKETQPTWQKNQENLQKARESLQKFYPPASKISSLLMNVARPQNFRSPFFDSTETRRRRRRSIDAEMNEEIERRVKELGVKRPQAKDSGEYNNLDSAIEKLSILDRALKIVAEMDRSEHRESETDFGKISTELKKLGEIVAQNAGSAALLPPPPSTSNDIELHKQCKIMSKSMEQRCLREPARPFVTLMKHVTDTTAKKVAGPIKKLLSRVQANQRNKRSADEVILENDIRLNEIPTEIFGDVKVADFVKMPYVRIEEKPAPKGLIEEELPKILNAIKGTFDRLVTTATDQMTTWWSNLG